MRSFVIGLLIVGLVACGTKAEKADKAAVETYVNTDLNGLIGMLWVGKKPLETIKPDHFDTAHGWFTRPSALETIVIPRMNQVLAGAAKITPPDALKPTHQLLVDVATAYRDAAQDLGDAVAANDKAKFDTAYAKLMAGHERYQRWQKAMDETLSTYKIELKDPAQPAALPK
jgi:hypothetical protein